MLRTWLSATTYENQLRFVLGRQLAQASKTSMKVPGSGSPGNSRIAKRVLRLSVIGEIRKQRLAMNTINCRFAGNNSLIEIRRAMPDDWQRQIGESPRKTRFELR
jgi:hypothetical protein